jgi:folate-binding protein YgfZ
MGNPSKNNVETAAWVDLSTTNPPLGVMQLKGPDSVKFLQGQVSADIARLAAGQSTLAGFHNREGRAIALLRVAAVDADELLAVLPRELIGDTVAKLGKFVFRAKTRLLDVSSEHAVWGAARSAVPPVASIVTLQWSATRQVCVLPAGALHDAAATAAARDIWQAADIAEGVPQVYRATSEAFVSQMLNLDVLGGIAFDKGCYTGQEVIARAHYRGRVKRRMQRFATADSVRLEAGATATLEGGATIRIVDVARADAARAEFLAVAPLASGTASSEATEPATDSAALKAELLALPYELPP